MINNFNINYKELQGYTLMPYLLVGENRRNYTVKEWLYILNTVVCRAGREDRWPDTIEGVILQPKQFSCFNEGDPGRSLLVNLYNGVASHENMMILSNAKHVVEAFTETGGGKGFFYTDHYVSKSFYSSAPSNHWCKQYRKVLEAGEHVFISSK